MQAADRRTQTDANHLKQQHDRVAWDVDGLEVPNRPHSPLVPLEGDEPDMQVEHASDLFERGGCY